MRAKVISFINMKGGVAKTTTTVGTASAMAGYFGKRVLVIDMDPQTNATVMLIGDNKWAELNEKDFTLYTAFQEKLFSRSKVPFSLEETLQRDVGNLDRVKGLDLLPSSLKLIKIQDQLYEIGKKTDYGVQPYEVLALAVNPIVSYYDYIFIDCPPNMGILTQNALYMSDYYIIPTIPDILSTYGIPEVIFQVLDFCRNWKEKEQWKVQQKDEIILLGIVATKVKNSNPLHKWKLEELEHDESIQPFHTIFTENARFAEAAEYRESMTFRQKWGYQKQAELFLQFSKEIMERIERNGL